MSEVRVSRLDSLAHQASAAVTGIGEGDDETSGVFDALSSTSSDGSLLTQLAVRSRPGAMKDDADLGADAFDIFSSSSDGITILPGAQFRCLASSSDDDAFPEVSRRPVAAVADTAMDETFAQEKVDTGPFVFDIYSSSSDGRELLPAAQRRPPTYSSDDSLSATLNRLEMSSPIPTQADSDSDLLYVLSSSDVSLGTPGPRLRLCASSSDDCPSPRLARSPHIASSAQAARQAPVPSFSRPLPTVCTTSTGPATFSVATPREYAKKEHRHKKKRRRSRRRRSWHRERGRTTAKSASVAGSTAAIRQGLGGQTVGRSEPPRLYGNVQQHHLLRERREVDVQKIETSPTLEHRTGSLHDMYSVDWQNCYHDNSEAKAFRSNEGFDPTSMRVSACVSGCGRGPTLSSFGVAPKDKVSQCESDLSGTASRTGYCAPKAILDPALAFVDEDLLELLDAVSLARGISPTSFDYPGATPSVAEPEPEVLSAADQGAGLCPAAVNSQVQLHSDSLEVSNGLPNDPRDACTPDSNSQHDEAVVGFEGPADQHTEGGIGTALGRMVAAIASPFTGLASFFGTDSDDEAVAQCSPSARCSRLDGCRRDGVFVNLQDVSFGLGSDMLLGAPDIRVRSDSSGRSSSASSASARVS